MEAGTVSTSRTISVTVNGTTYEREVEARKLLIHFIRDDLDLTGSHIGCDTGNCGACSVIVDGTLAKSCMMLAVQADGSSDRDGRGARRRRGAVEAPAGVQRPPRAPVRLLHAGDADERDRAPAREPASVRRRDQEGPAGQHLPLHRLLEHLRGRQGGVANDRSTTVAPERPRPRRRPRPGRARASRARRTGASSRGRASSSTTSSGTGWATSTSCARRTRTRTSPRSTSRRQRRPPASTAR